MLPPLKVAVFIRLEHKLNFELIFIYHKSNFGFMLHLVVFLVIFTPSRESIIKSL